jgi:hydrogenase-4 component B
LCALFLLILDPLLLRLLIPPKGQRIGCLVQPLCFAMQKRVPQGQTCYGGICIMELFLVALALLVLTAFFLAAASLVPHVPSIRLCVHIAGPTGIILACALGMAGLFHGSWGAVVPWYAPWGLALGGGALALDGLSRCFLLPVFGLGAVCAFSGAASLFHHDIGHNIAAHWFFYTLLVLALALVLTARDSVFFLISWELMSLSPFFLIEFDDQEASVREASWVYLVAAHLGAVVLLGFFALAWHMGGSSSALFAGLSLSPAMGSALFVLALVGFGAKAGLAPMHIWLPEAHPAAPSHVSALLSGAMINAGLYGIFRTYTLLNIQGGTPAWWGWCLLLLGLGSALTGIIKASGQSNLKRLLAYSSVENMGIMLMGLGTGLIGMQTGHTGIATLGFAACLIHMINHAAFKGLLFLCAGEILHAVQTVRLDLLGGLQQRMPLLGAAFAVGAAAIICLPPLNGFAGEFVLALGLATGVTLPQMEIQLGLLAALTGLALVSGLAAATFAKAYGIAFLGEPRTRLAANPHLPTAYNLVPLAFPAAACLGLGLAAPQLFALVAQALPLPQEVLAPHTAHLRASLHTVVLVGLAGMGIVALLVLWRRHLLRGAHTQRNSTWGCGFQKGTARIQYTDASFTDPQTEVFSRLMGVQVQSSMDKSYFPAHASYSIEAPDRLRLRLYAPLFDAVRRLCDACKIIQSGRIHLYILYMLATLVALLLWGFAA